MSDQLQELFSAPLFLDPVHFVEKARTIDGEKFEISNNGRNYLIDFYRYLCVGVLKEKKPVVVVKGRQVEMTEAALNVSLYFMYNYKFFNVLHAFPTDKQVSVFSKERLQGALRFSVEGMLEKAKADHKNASDTVSAVEFRNHNFYYLRSAWAEADSLRGLSVDALMRDEFQDWTDAAIANTQQSTARSKYAVEFSFGTPKSAGSPFEKLWDFSDKRYFHSRCISCKKLFMINMDNFIHELIVKCNMCGVEQTKAQANAGGKWIPTRTVGKEGRIGYHISQLIHPEMTKEQITRSKQEYTDSKFKNEVLGEFFTGGALPLDKASVIARCCQPYADETFQSMIVPPSETYMGVDWGSRNDTKDKGAYTVVTIISRDGVYGKYKVERTLRLTDTNHMVQVAKIKELIKLYNCISVVADQGYGHVQIQMLQQEYGYKIKSCYYHPQYKAKLGYNNETGLLTVDRDAFLEEIIDIINKGRLIIPWKNGVEIEWFIEHLCNTELKTVMRTGNVYRKYDKNNQTEPNDGLHALNYAYIASVFHSGHNEFGRSPVTSKYQQDISRSFLLAGNGTAPRNMTPMQNITRNNYRHMRY